MFCRFCGAEVHDEAVICVKCGCSLETKIQVPQDSKDDTLATVVKVFMILGCIANGWLLLPLAWCIPMTVSVFRHLKEKKPIGTGMKVCSLLFVNLIAGICMLCMDD